MSFDTSTSAFHWRTQLTETQQERVYQRSYYQRRKAGEVMSLAKKLTAERVLEIRAALARGEVQRVIAARHGVTQSSIRDIKSGKHWKHVT